MFESPQQVAARFGEMTDAVWLTSAMGSVLSRGLTEPLDRSDPAGRLLVAFGFMTEDRTGLVAVPAFAEAVRGREAAFAEGVRSTLGQAATAAFSAGEGSAWSRFGDEILIAQGLASAMGGPGLAMFVIPVLEGLADRFAAGGRFLDVGVGVAGLACAFCQAVPTARVVGLDPLPRAIHLAQQAVAERGLADRIELRGHGVEHLDMQREFDLAWLPLPFIPADVVPAALARVFDALEPGGWLLLAGPVYEPGVGGEIARWQTHLAGGSLPTDEERAAMLGAAGYVEPTPVIVPPGAPPLFAARRPVENPEKS